MPNPNLEAWEVWFPSAGATGMLVGRGRIDPTDVLLVHSVPDVITVEVHDDAGNRVAYGGELKRTLSSPVCRLTRKGGSISREDIWPTERDYGLPILLPGGEVGILQSWWNADDRLEWRWQIELYNSRR
jgi:hypothetical protein